MYLCSLGLCDANRSKCGGHIACWTYSCWLCDRVRSASEFTWIGIWSDITPSVFCPWLSLSITWVASVFNAVLWFIEEHLDGNRTPKNSWIFGRFEPTNVGHWVHRCELGWVRDPIYQFGYIMETTSGTAGLYIPVSVVDNWLSPKMFPAGLLLVGIQFLPYSPVCPSSLLLYMCVTNFLVAMALRSRKGRRSSCNCVTTPRRR